MPRPFQYALRRTLPPWSLKWRLKMLESVIGSWRLDEVVLNIDAEEFNHAQLSMEWLDHYLPMLEEAERRLEARGVRVSLKTWNWEAQFEDTALTAKFQNMGHQDADGTAIYLLRRFPGDPARRAQAEELLRFTEDQFICWEAPWKGRRLPSDLREGFWSKDTDNWHTPAGMEQFDCRWPIDSCTGKLLATCLALHKATGEARWLQKATALADSMTQMVQPDGRLPTWWLQPDDSRNDWHSDMIQAVEALEELDEFLNGINNNNKE